MKDWLNSLKRIGVCVLLAIPFWLLGSTGLFEPALVGYVLALVLYYGIQFTTRFHRPTDGLLVVGLLSLLYAFLVPAYAKARSGNDSSSRLELKTEAQVDVVEVQALTGHASTRSPRTG